MIDKIIAYSIKNKFIIILLVLALVAGGVYCLTTVNLDSTPDITDNQVQVITVSQNLATEDIEQFVTYPVEQAMANLPGVTEIRSISRFGLSVVTIVFKDNMGTYLPRQIVQEKLGEVSGEIPSQFGAPEMGPITTGLGEIFQYTIKPKKGAAKKYTPTELRTIQDWIVKRQMSLIPGVVDVNSFGGSVKQYEIALNPDKLNAMHVSIGEVFKALEDNNVNAGGAYIERNHLANFIRGEGLVKSLDDIRNIVVKTEDGVPVLVNDVASDVRFGSMTRYGAFTQDGEEAVGGMVLMLKGENSNKVIKNVKARIAEVQKTLPEGLEIVPFLDRSELIHRTTSTIAKNLMEGALIVLFVLVLLLGSLRGGLVTASVIPLALLFAFIMMKIFNVWANLMSLGAIDFGVIVDGAVIIVEGTVHEIESRIRQRQAAGEKQVAFSRKDMDELTYKASSTMMDSAFFGQLIILIVFTPILFLSGVEGKMFRPMAFTFGFALIGSIILCLTYVPMMSSLCLRPFNAKDSFFARLERSLDRFSGKLMSWLAGIYAPALNWALKSKGAILGIAGALLVAAVVIFSGMGAEFIPSLDEGDIAMQTFLRPGSSLSETIKREEEVERLLKKSFPEVKTCLARIGVADIPTDPMGFDYTDSFIILEKDRSKWTSAKTKDELIERMKDTLSQLPGLNFSFSQPVELRFNELLTGVRSDVAVKLYGDDLDVLAEKGQEMADIIGKVKGATDVSLESTSGMPQMTVRYDRPKLAQYGLDVNKLNEYVSAAFAGTPAGVIFEGEKRFDMVIRLDEAHRQSIDDLKNLYVDLPDGHQIPLQEVADISFQPGPMQISRDNTYRRISVGVNVRGRDVQSVVNDIRQQLDSKLELPAGYRITYGGEFENLQNALKRLSVALPVALALIFLLLFFALHSLPQTLMIFIAVPLAAIGGVLNLWFRGMPFSISAGVGFIVLFGVAVLNGLVLVNRFNSLKKEGVKDVTERIRIGTRERLRPILLTALSAMLGFLPMAVSHSAGAEVQRPLATVVIGGLFSATLLTLLVVPVLYALIEGWSGKKDERPEGSIPMQPAAVCIAVCLGLMLAAPQASAQDNCTIPADSMQKIALDEAVARAIRSYPSLKAARLEVKNREALRKTAFDLGETEISTGAEEAGQGNADAVFTTFEVRQDLDLLGLGAKAKYQGKAVSLARTESDLSELEVAREVSIAWGDAYCYEKRYELYSQLDTIYQDFEKAAKLRYETESTSKLEYLSAMNQSRQMAIQKEQARQNYHIALHRLNKWFCSDTMFSVDCSPATLPAMPGALLPDTMPGSHPSLELYRRKIDVADANLRVQKSAFLPKLFVEAGTQRIGAARGFYTYSAGISVPIFFQGQLGRTQSASIESGIARENYNQAKIEAETEYQSVSDEYRKWAQSVKYYGEVALPVALEQRRGAVTAYREGAIDYVGFIQNMKDAIQVEIDYWDSFENYLDTGFRLEYLLDTLK